MTTPDVRVRLSAEGVAEVVTALKKVQAEGEKTGKAGHRSFLNLNSILGSTTGLLGGLGVAVGVGAFVGFIRNSAEAADEVGKLGQKVGASVTNLSALNVVAATADVSTEKLTVGLIKLNARLAELADGSPQAQAAFRQLGLSAQDFKGKDAVQSFELVSKRMAELGDGARKTKTAVEIFGKSGAQLIPLMNDLADEGLGPLTERARDLGVLFSDDMVASTQKLNDDVRLLQMQAQAFGAQFATGVAPSVSQGLQIIIGDLSQTQDSWQVFGEAVGGVLKFVVAVVAAAVDVVVTLLAGIVVAIDGLARASARAIIGDLPGALAVLRATADTEVKGTEKILDRLKGRFELAFQAPQPAKPRKVAQGGDSDSVDLARQQAEAARSVRDAELTFLKAQLKARGDAEKRSFDEGLSGLREYYDARRRIISEEADAEVASLLARKAVLSAEPDQVKAQAEGKTIDMQVRNVRFEQEGSLAALASEETAALRDMGDKALAIERRILEARGQRHEAAMLAIDEEIRQADLLFRQQGLNDQERLAQVDRLRATLNAGIGFEDAQGRSQQAMADLGLDRQKIDAQVRAGQITQMDGERQILALERERIGVLQQVAQALLAAADATGDPEKIRQAREFAQAVDGIDVAAKDADHSMTRFRDTLEQSGIQALTDFFAEGITEAKNFSNAVRQMALAVVNSIRQMAAQMLAAQIFKGLSGLFGTGGSVVSGGKAEGGQVLASGGQVRKAAIRRFSSGGFLRGPGTGTSDSLVAVTDAGRPLRLSNGEFVVRAAAVQQPGALQFLQNFNQLSMAALKPVRAATDAPRFAGGGLIEKSADKDPQARDGRMLIGLDEGLVLKALESPRGQKVFVELVGRNRRTLQRVLDG
jgi:hypothetical protein